MKFAFPSMPTLAAVRAALRDARPTLPPGALAFALRNTAASLLALYIAFRMNLDDPKWAASTVWIVAQGSRGMGLSKSQYRILGTAIGAAVALALTGAFAQTPELFLPALAAWIGLCAGVATFQRNFRAYAAVLAGYTAAIVAMDAVSAPLHAFDIAVARFLYVVVGILCAALFDTVFAPGAPLHDVRTRLARYLERAVALGAGALRREPNGAAVHRLFADALELDTAAEYAAAGAPPVRGAIGHLRAAALGVLTAQAAAQAIREHAARAHDASDPLVDEVARVLDGIAASGDAQPRMAALRARVGDALRAEAAAPDTSRLLTLDRLAALLGGFERAFASQALLDRPELPPSRVRYAFHRDPVLAWHNGIRAFIAVLAASAIWIFTAWPAGGGFVAITAVVGALFSTRPNSVRAAIGFLKGSACAAVAGVVCNFILLPAVSGFEMLAYILGVFLIGTGIAMRHPRTAAMGSAFSIFFWNFTSPDNTTRIGDAAFLNSALATMLGIAFGALIFALVFPGDPGTSRRRLHRAVRRDLAEIARDPGAWHASAWLSRTADRLARELGFAGSLPQTLIERDMRDLLAIWGIGDSLLSLAELATREPVARRVAAVVRARVARADFTRLEQTCDAAARLLRGRMAARDGDAAQALLNGIVLLRRIADATAEHGGFLRGRRD
ncbi:MULTISPECIES: FUSC family protein [Burkholderia]|uniref:FUSC family protein n=8 Tax=Burkholderia TaxID=32008 RepID=A0A3R9B9U6_9BURK|nr:MULTISPECIES: FUSC family protein [Burkholderia]ABK11315.1 Fusaric acid resistance protein conserved region [Burkholderia cenocepacia HI2424]ACA94846.1 Fusaric acid resistance protein conserved region [Burkholderia orbicola MC0-3]AQQ24194.1 fusaric acid resistance protein [Burkholderia cenocepacia]AQT52993.1 fusaric acid resistance protein [Burkholderia cenocepacia]MBJ9666891.1 FUSC family protein [Burkholderia cenocepacia]